MKTPKEILLQSHQAMESKLNAARRNALETVNRPRLAQGWRDFVYALRWHLAGLSAVWMVVLLLSLDDSSTQKVTVAQGKVPSAQVLLASLLKNRRELIELTETPTTGETFVLPGRRSEIQPAIAVA